MLNEGSSLHSHHRVLAAVRLLILQTFTSTYSCDKAEQGNSLVSFFVSGEEGPKVEESNTETLILFCGVQRLIRSTSK